MVCKVEKTSKGDEAKSYLLKNKKGMEIVVSDYGATLIQVKVPDREGNLLDVVLGYDKIEGYENGGVFFGATV